MNEQAVHAGRFAEVVLPHLDSAYNLAHWLTDDAGDAEEIVQEAHLTAFQAFAGFRGMDARAWLLAIVRNASYRWLLTSRHQAAAEVEGPTPCGPETGGPDTQLLHAADTSLVERALRALPVPFREVLVLRELEGLTYADIAAVVGVEIGEVMPRLSRARSRFRHVLGAELARGNARNTAGGDAREEPMEPRTPQCTAGTW